MNVLFIIRDIEGVEPLGIMYMAALLRQAGHKVRFLPTRGVDLVAEVRQFAPAVIGYGVCTGQHTYYLALNRFLKSVNMGIECADETYRREVLHRPMSNQTIRDACRRLHDHGIAILADNMVGLPGRTLEDDIETLRFNAECQIEYPLAMILQPYPGTEIDRYAREHGHFDGDYSAIGYNYYFRSPLRFASEAERQQIENLQKLFAVTAEAPWLLPIVRRLIRLRSNLVFTSIFRWWYAWCYLRRIMRHRLRWADVLETLRVLFGIYPKEAFDADLEENDEEARAVVRGVPGGDDVGGCGPVLDGLPQEGEVSLAAASP